MYSLFSDDITFCASECDNEECMRHPSNIKEKEFPHSYALFKGTETCPDEELSKPSHRYDDLKKHCDDYMSEMKRLLYGTDTGGDT